MKKTLAFILCLMMTLSLVICAQAATDDHQLNGVPLERGCYAGKTVRIGTPWPPQELPEQAKEFAEFTGCEIVYENVAYGDDPTATAYRESIINMMAADACPDVINGALFVVPVWVNKNLIQPWDAYIDLTDATEKYDMTGLIDTAFALDGKHYAIGDATAPLWNTSLIFYNKADFEDNGLDDPYELFKKGEWKWDIFADMCNQLTYDGGSGSIDHWGLTTWFTVEPYVYSNGGSSVKIIDGKPTYTLNASDAVFGMNFAAQMPAGPDLSNIGPDAYFADGSASMYYEGVWYIDDAYDLLGDKLGIVPFPTGPDYSATPSRDFIDDVWMWSLSASAKEPQAAADYFRYLYSPKTYDESDPRATDTEDYSKWGGEEKYQEILTWCGNAAPEAARSYGDLSSLLYDNVWWCIGEDTPANLTESVAQEAQAIIDDVLK